MGEYDMTKQLSLAAVIAGAMALPATAGGLSEPIMEPAIVVQDVETNDSSGLAMWLIMAAIIVAASAN